MEIHVLPLRSPQTGAPGDGVRPVPRLLVWRSWRLAVVTYTR